MSAITKLLSDNKPTPLGWGIGSAIGLLTLFYIKMPRNPLLSEEVAKEHFNHLAHTEPNEGNSPDWKPPHRVRYSKKTSAQAEEMKPDVIIVGSGLGSLTTGSLLAQRGWKVLILEQHDQAGGCLHTFEEKGYEFDVGLHYIGGMVGSRWSSLRKMYDAVTGGRVEWCKLDDPYDSAVCTGEYEDPADSIHFYGDYGRTERELKAKLTPEEAKQVSSFFGSLNFTVVRMAGWLVAKCMPIWLRRTVGRVIELPSAGVLNVTTADYMKNTLNITSKKVHGILTYLFGDYGLMPSVSSWAVHAVVFNHWRGGGFYPYGGSSALAMGACEVIRQNGGLILVNSRVKRIVVENGKAVGVQMEKDGKVFRAKRIVSDVGARNTFLRLLEPEDIVKVDKSFISELKQDEQGDLDNKAGMAPSCALLNLFIGLDAPAEALGVPATNAWVVPGWDHEKNLEKFWADDAAELPVAFIGSNSAKDFSYEKRFGKNRGSIMVLAPVEYKWFKKWEANRVHARGDDYDTLKAHWEEKLLKKLFQVYPKVKGHITYKDLGTPLSNNYYLGVNHGEVYGLTHSLDRCWKHRDVLSVHTDIPGLYLTGQDLMTAGVSAALMAGVMTVGAISKPVLASHIHNLI